VMQFPLRGPEPGEQGKRLAATHVCVCNLDSDDWAPEDWKKENCAFAGFAHPGALEHPPVVPKTGQGKETHTLLNGGMFLFEPSEATWNDMWKFVAEHKAELRNYQFPDQDLLKEWWRDRWYAVGWKYNALKTWRYWHPDMVSAASSYPLLYFFWLSTVKSKLLTNTLPQWRDDQVSCLHYIVDKPWSKRIGADGKAGYLGKDGETHRWWWDEYEVWKQERVDKKERGILDLMNGLVASPLVEKSKEEEESVLQEEISEKIDGVNEVDSQAIEVR
jgi:inositol 3-alpha-galactosyltransferase